MFKNPKDSLSPSCWGEFSPCFSRPSNGSPGCHWRGFRRDPPGSEAERRSCQPAVPGTLLSFGGDTSVSRVVKTSGLTDGIPRNLENMLRWKMFRNMTTETLFQATATDKVVLLGHSAKS